MKTLSFCLKMQRSKLGKKLNSKQTVTNQNQKKRKKTPTYSCLKSTKKSSSTFSRRSTIKLKNENNKN
jgi:hypothetical protein